MSSCRGDFALVCPAGPCRVQTGCRLIGDRRCSNTVTILKASHAWSTERRRFKPRRRAHHVSWPVLRIRGIAAPSCVARILRSKVNPNTGLVPCHAAETSHAQPMSWGRPGPRRAHPAQMPTCPTSRSTRAHTTRPAAPRSARPSGRITTAATSTIIIDRTSVDVSRGPSSWINDRHTPRTARRRSTYGG